MLIGKAALIESVGGQRGYADWTNPDHRARRLLSEFIGMAGLTFVLSGGAAISYYAIDHNLTLKQAALAKGVSEELYDKVVIPINLTHPGSADVPSGPAKN